MSHSRYGVAVERLGPGRATVRHGLGRPVAGGDSGDSSGLLQPGGPPAGTAAAGHHDQELCLPCSDRNGVARATVK